MTLAGRRSKQLIILRVCHRSGIYKWKMKATKECNQIKSGVADDDDVRVVLHLKIEERFVGNAPFLTE